MRVAVVIDTWYPFIGGGQINAWEISKRLARSGVKVDIITRNNGQDKFERVNNLNVYKLGPKSKPDNSLSKLLFVFRSFLFIYRGDYDLIHAHAFLPGITARLLMLSKGIPAVFTVHGTSINTNLNNFVSRSIEKFILTQILYSAQITVSQDFLKIKNVNRNVVYIPNGVGIKAFDKIVVPKAKEPTLIFVGRLHPQKNLKRLIEAVSQVKAQILRIRLLVVGEGRLKKELQEQVKLLNVDENVRFLGEKTGKDLVRLYKSSQIFILPSIYEGQPLTLLEAWAAKLPVIVSRTGDCQYLVKNGVNGYVIKSNDAQEIKKSILSAFKNKKGFRVLGSAAYRQAKNFTWDKSARKTLELYKSLIHN